MEKHGRNLNLAGRYYLKYLILTLFFICLFHTTFCQIDSSLIGSDSAIIKGDKYTIELRNEAGDISTIYILRNDTIILVKIDYSPADSKFIDFNGDGYKDILFVHYPTQTPDICDLYLFNEKKKNFAEVADFDNFPEPKIITKGHYYSYHHSGCADMDWDSDLFCIKHMKAIKLANIHGIGCDNESRKGVYIYDERKLASKLVEYRKFDEMRSDKWKFIQSYWRKNYKKFTP